MAKAKPDCVLLRVASTNAATDTLIETEMEQRRCACHRHSNTVRDLKCPRLLGAPGVLEALKETSILEGPRLQRVRGRVDWVGRAGHTWGGALRSVGTARGRWDESPVGGQRVESACGLALAACSALVDLAHVRLRFGPQARRALDECLHDQGHDAAAAREPAAQSRPCTGESQTT